jgi:hypothetical protein
MAPTLSKGPLTGFAATGRKAGRCSTPTVPYVLARRVCDQLDQPLSLAIDVAVLAHERTPGAAHGGALSGVERQQLLQGTGQRLAVAGRVEASPLRAHELGQPDSVAGHDRHLHGQRLLDHNGHRVAVAVGPDDAGHGQHRGLLEAVAHAGAVQGPRQLDKALEVELGDELDQPLAQGPLPHRSSPVRLHRSNGAHVAGRSGATAELRRAPMVGLTRVPGGRRYLNRAGISRSRTT